MTAIREKVEDPRTVNELCKQWRKLQEIRRQLTRDGHINGDATTDDVVAALRKAIPPELFSVSRSTPTPPT